MDNIRSWKGMFSDLPEEDLETTEKSVISGFLKAESVSATVSTTEGHEGHRVSDIENIEIRILDDPKTEKIQEEKKLEIWTDRLLSIVSGESVVTSEDLILNENIDFLYEHTDKSNSFNASPSFNYSATDKSSSVFQSFFSPHLLMQSLPESDHEVSFDNKRPCDTQTPGFFIERYDLEKLKNDWSENRVKSRCEKDLIMQQIESFVKGNLKRKSGKGLLFEIAGKSMKERKEEYMCGGCGCSGCNII